MEKYEQIYEVREARTYILPGEAAGEAAAEARAEQGEASVDRGGQEEGE